MLILSVDAMHTRRAEWNRRQNPDFLVPQDIILSQLLTESWVVATSLREDHVKQGSTSSTLHLQGYLDPSGTWFESDSVDIV